MSSPTVVLIGPPGAGKTTIGQRIARALGTSFQDSDQLIEQRCQQRCGDVFTELGEDGFRELEADIIADALQDSGVLALGGGAVTTERVRSLLQRHRVVWVSVGEEEGFARTCIGGYRPILQSSDPQARYSQLLAERKPLYKQCASFKARTDHRSPQQVVADILNWLDDCESDRCATTTHP